ncbi:putative membrane protein [Paratrimastix pyriformis]|uniref:Membrane protein n=1 Tax=Paratrimastix pyriformis TaxID=342808 RepID=A0ABQ8UGC9_9EUKA|nr:putative membrane protein [Paratrimastix pyriformis]
MEPATKVKSVPRVDLDRYTGKWFEIFRMPFFFEKLCVSDVTAEYQLMNRNRISIVNSCTKANGKRNVARAVGTVVPGSNGARLKVSFWRPMKGDYWVIGLHPEYQWALVGEPKGKYLWLLSRTPTLPQEEIDKALQMAKDQGYDIQKLIWTKQTVEAKSG